MPAASGTSRLGAASVGGAEFAQQKSLGQCLQAPSVEGHIHMGAQVLLLALALHRGMGALQLTPGMRCTAYPWERTAQCSAAQCSAAQCHVRSTAPASCYLATAPSSVAGWYGVRAGSQASTLCCSMYVPPMLRAAPLREPVMACRRRRACHPASFGANSLARAGGWCECVCVCGGGWVGWGLLQHLPMGRMHGKGPRRRAASYSAGCSTGGVPHRPLWHVLLAAPPCIRVWNAAGVRPLAWL